MEEMGESAVRAEVAGNRGAGKVRTI